MWIYLNGRFVPREAALVSAFDHGFLYGDGIYETLRAYRGRFFMLSKHVARLHRSADLIGLKISMVQQDWVQQDWPALLDEVLARNELGKDSQSTSQKPADAYVRITVTRGEGDIGLDAGLCPQPTLLILAKPLTPYPNHFYEQGVRLAIVSVRRNLATALPPRIKSLNFLNNILAKSEATKATAFDGLMLNAEGALAECTVSNIFFARKGRLCTPSLSCGILDGITREVVTILGRENGIQLEEGTYTPKHLLHADECFLTNTSMEIMPVSEVDGTKIGSGCPGPLTRKLQDLFRSNLPRFLS